MAAGYLNTFDKHYSTAAGYYKRAEIRIPNEPLPRNQLHLLKVLNTLAAAPTIDHALEQKLVPDIQWLESSQKDGGFPSDYAFDWLKKTTAAKYLLAGDKDTSESYVSTPAFYTDTRNAQALKTFLSKPPKPTS